MMTESDFAGDDIILDARIEAGNWPDLAFLEQLAMVTLNGALANHDLRLAKTVLKGSEISLLFTDDAHIQTINTAYRGQDKPTNVLSFPQQKPDSIRFGPLLGDLVFASQTLFREADLEKKQFTHHLQHLLVHGFLHLVGYDHEDDDEAEKMEGLEVMILAELGLPNPYDGHN